MSSSLKRLLLSASVGGLFGFILGAALTTVVLFLNKNHDMLPEMMLITLPERLIYSIGGFNQTADHRELLLRTGWLPTIVINGVLAGGLCFTATLIVMAILRRKTAEHD